MLASINAPIIVSVAAVVLTGIGMIVAGVWVVGKLEGIVSSLQSDVSKLTTEMRGVRKWVHEVEVGHSEMKERVARLEAKVHG